MSGGEARLRPVSDVVAAALIAASVGVIGNALTAFVALTTTARHTRADAARLRDEHREADRRVRRDAYQRLLVTLESLDLLSSHYTAAPTREDFERWLRDSRAAGVGVQLVESSEVRAARKRVGELLDDLANEVMHRIEAGQSIEVALGHSYIKMRPAMNERGRALGDAMRDDLAFVAEPANT